MNESTNKLGKSSILVFAGKVIEALLLIVFNIIAVKLLDVGVYGNFIFIFNFLQIIAMVTRLGLDRGIIGFIPTLNFEKNSDKANRLITFTVLITTIISVIFTLILLRNSSQISEIVLNSQNSDYTLLLLTPMLVILNFMNISVGLFRGLDRIQPYIISRNFIIPILMIIFLVLLYFSGIFDDRNLLVYTHFFAWGIGSVYLLLNLIKHKNFSVPQLHDENLKKLMVFSFPLIFSTFMGFLIIKLDSLMIGYFLDDYQVGIYNVAFQIAMMSSFVLTSFSTIFAPKIAILSSKKEYNELGHSYKIITGWITIVNLIFFGVILILHKELMMIFGPEFVVGSIALILLTLGQVVKSSVGPVGDILVLTINPKYEFYTILLGLILNFSLNLIFIPKFGINGAAFTSFVTFSFINIIQFLLIYKRYKFNPFNGDYIKVIIAFVISLAVTLVIKMNTNIHYFVEILFLSPIYVCLFLYLVYRNILSTDERDKIKKTIKLFNLRSSD